MFVKSPFPDPPQLPEANAHHILFGRPDQSSWTDFPVHIDGTTGERVMQSELVSRIEALSTGLAIPLSQGGLGVAPTELIGIVGENSSEYITLFHACLRNATTIAPISSYSTPYELNHALNVTQPTRLFIDAKLLDRMLPVCLKAGVTDDKIYILKSPQNEKEIKGRRTCLSIIHHVKKNSIKTVAVGVAHKDTAAYLVFSSGTTGLPKAIKISHGNLAYTLGQFSVLGQVADAVEAPVARKPAGIPVVLACLPFYHSYGLSFYFLAPCLAPYTLVILPRWDLGSALESIPKYKVTTIGLVPSLIHQIANHPAIEKIDFSSIVDITCGGSYLPSDLLSKMKKVLPKNVKFTEGYGMSEATVSATIQPLDGYLGGKLNFVPGSSGVLSPGMEARITRPDGTDADVNEIGELWLRGDNISSGYLTNDKANNETFKDGWLRTGDYFRVDEKGYFWYGDRVKDTLKVSGSQVSPMEIENCLFLHPDKLIVDATVAGVTGGLTLDEKVPRAWVVLSPSGKKLGKEMVIQILDSWHRENLSKYKHLRGGIEVLDELPRTPTGKILRKKLQDKYEAELKKSAKSKL